MSGEKLKNKRGKIANLLFKLLDTIDDLVFIKEKKSDNQFVEIYVNKKFASFFELKPENIIEETDFAELILKILHLKQKR